MFCNSCGGKNEDSAKFCAYCGAPLNAPTSKFVQSEPEPGDDSVENESTSAPATNPGGLGFDGAAPQPSAFNGGGSVASTTTSVGNDFLVLNIVLTLACCVIPTSLAGVVCSILARNAKSRGEWERALALSTAAKTLFWTTIGFAILCALGTQYWLHDPTFVESMTSSIEEETEEDTPDYDDLLDAEPESESADDAEPADAEVEFDESAE